MNTPPEVGIDPLTATGEVEIVHLHLTCRSDEVLYLPCHAAIHRSPTHPLSRIHPTSDKGCSAKLDFRSTAFWEVRGTGPEGLGDKHSQKILHLYEALHSLGG